MTVDTSNDDADFVPAPKATGTRTRASPRLTRAMADRRSTQRPAIGGEFRGRLHIDVSLLDPAYQYTWVRQETFGEYDESNIQDALDLKGYDPVTTDDAPHLAGRTLPGRERTDKLVRRGGLVLMKRPREVAQQERTSIARDAREQMRSVTRQLEETREKASPEYLQRPDDEGVSVTVDRPDRPTMRERFADAGE